MSESLSGQQHYQYVAKAIAYIQQHAQQQPSLKQIAQEVGLSEYHLQRVFTRWAGVSPKRFLQFLTKERALQILRVSGDTLHAALDSGLSGPGRLHDLMISCEAMSPGEIKALGKNLEIGFGHADSPFGQILLGWTPRGICYLSFIDDDVRHRQHEMMQQWPYASFQCNDSEALAISNQIFAPHHKAKKIHLMVQGTNFQLKVWEALLSTQPGQLVSYSRLAELAGSSKAQRAVGSTLANNSIGWLIPCHRVIRGTGEFGRYRWGTDRKLAMQGWEACHYRS
ncbi:MAG: methylated-DNA--[protein]-cysteine S-methyltransferase [Endozoicomonas sp.]